MCEWENSNLVGKMAEIKCWNIVILQKILCKNIKHFNNFQILFKNKVYHDYSCNYIYAYNNLAKNINEGNFLWFSKELEVHLKLPSTL